MQNSSDAQTFLKLMANAAFCELRKFCDNVAYDRKPIVDLALTLQKNFLEVEISTNRPKRRVQEWRHFCDGDGCETIIPQKKWESGQHLCYYCNEKKIRSERDSMTPKCSICRRKLRVIFGKQLTEHEACSFCRQDLRAKGHPLRIAG